MFEYFYHQIIRKTIIGFGSLFNGITIQKENSSDEVVSSFQVPLGYGPTQKFLARIEQDPDLNSPIQMTLPRMSFEFIGLSYDQTRKVTTTQIFTKADANNKNLVKKAYMPVPYNLEFELSIYTKLNDDMLQIIEQIVPYFQPSYNITVDLLEEIGEKKDIPIVLENILMSDEYEGNFSTRRALIYTLKFTAKTYLFGPVTSATSDIIRKASISYPVGEKTDSPTREVVYSSEPRAIKNYTGIVIGNLSKDIISTDIVIEVEDVSQITTKTYIDIEGEEMYVKSITGNKLTVQRGADGTQVTDHVRGTEIKSITSSDNELIEFGDDFGFSGITF